MRAFASGRRLLRRPRRPRRLSRPAGTAGLVRQFPTAPIFGRPDRWRSVTTLSRIDLAPTTRPFSSSAPSSASARISPSTVGSPSAPASHDLAGSRGAVRDSRRRADLISRREAVLFKSPCAPYRTPTRLRTPLAGSCRRRSRAAPATLPTLDVFRQSSGRDRAVFHGHIFQHPPCRCSGVHRSAARRRDLWSRSGGLAPRRNG